MKLFQHPAFVQRAVAMVAVVVLLSGCLTIEENYTFKKDGSGTMEYVVDMSALAELLKSVESLDGEKEKGKDNDLGEMDLLEETTALKALPGIKKVKIKKEQDGYVQRLSFRFADVNALNGALNVLIPDSTGMKYTFFQWEGNTLVRTNNRHATELGMGMTEEQASDSDDMTGFLQSMQYKYSFTFDEAIASLDAAEGVVREDPSTREVKLSTDWSVIMQTPGALDLRITLDR